MMAVDEMQTREWISQKKTEEHEGRKVWLEKGSLSLH